MAYKRYFYRKGKKFGPYYYESYRDKNGKVRKKYVGTEDPDKKEEETVVENSMESVTLTNSRSKLFMLGVLVVVLIIVDLSVIFML